MLVKPAAAVTIAALFVPEVASAATIVIFTDPMSLERRAVVLDTRGPDRVLLCHAPPSTIGCTAVPMSRARR